MGFEKFLEQDEKSYRLAQLQELWQKEQQKISPEILSNAEKLFEFHRHINTSLVI